MTGKTQHSRLYDTLRERIMAGEYAPGEKMPSESMLGKEFDVSRITVIRALSDMVADGLIWRRQGVGSFVAAVPEQELRLGVMIPGMETDSRDSIYPMVVHYLSRLAVRHQWGLLTGRAELPNEQDPSGHKPVAVARRLVKDRVNSVVYAPLPAEARCATLNANVLAEFGQANVPVVLLGRNAVRHPGRISHDLVSMDDYHAGYDVGRHLLTLGCRHILFVCSSLYFSSSRQRLDGIRYACEAENIPAPDGLLWGGAVDATKLLKYVQKKPVDALVTGNDVCAGPVMRLLLDAGIAIPKRVKMASFDDAPSVRDLPVPLTSFAQPVEAIASALVSTLVERQSHPAMPPRIVLLQGRLIKRTSTQE